MSITVVYLSAGERPVEYALENLWGNVVGDEGLLR